MRFVLFIIVVVLFICTGFQVADTSGVFTRPKVEEYYLESMNRFHKSRENNCQMQAIELARMRVDTVLTGKKFLVEVDSFLLYPRAKKPEIPTFDFSDDSIDVDPLFYRDSFK